MSGEPSSEAFNRVATNKINKDKQQFLEKLTTFISIPIPILITSRHFWGLIETVNHRKHLMLQKIKPLNEIYIGHQHNHFWEKLPEGLKVSKISA